MNQKEENTQKLNSSVSPYSFPQSFISSIATNININFTSGLITGITTTALFNPWDRTIYLSVKNKTPFLKEIFNGNPYQGFMQAIVQRTFSGLVYFAAAGHLRSILAKNEKFNKISEDKRNFLVGTFAGIFNGCALNHLSVVKYYTWGNDNRRFLSSAKSIYKKGGIRVFFKGINATISRDIAFGIIYEVSRFKLSSWISNEKSESKNIICNLFSACIATVVSGPFNFARNIKYSVSAKQIPPTTFHIIYRELFLKSLSQPNTLSFLQQRMRVGWGTGRVAVGMAVGQYVFDNVKRILSNAENEKE